MRDHFDKEAFYRIRNIEFEYCLSNMFFQWDENSIKRSAESYLIGAMRYLEHVRNTID